MAALRRATIARQLVPVYVWFVQKRTREVQPLLDGVCDFLPSPAEVPYEAYRRDGNGTTVQLSADPSLPLVALAFKLEDGRYGQLTYVRIYHGTLRKGDTIVNVYTGRRVRVPRIGRIHADELHDIEIAAAGDIVALFSVECSSGDTLTDGQLDVILSSIYVPSPVI